VKGWAWIKGPVTRFRRVLDLSIAFLLAAGAFVLYVLTLAPAVLPGDSGEFQFVPYLLGIAHPTGYPLYCLLGWAWSHLLPVGDVAYRLNLFSAFWTAAAVGLLFPTATSLLQQQFPFPSAGLPRLIAALVAVTLAVTPTLWSQAIIAEVYGLNLFFVVLLFYLVLRWTKSRAPGTLLAAAACFGLSLAHHRTTLLLLPALVAYLWLTDRKLFRDWRLIFKILACLALPLALYVYIPLRAPQTPYLHLPLTTNQDLVLYDNTWAGFLNFVLGGPFGGSLDLSVDLGSRLAMAWGLLLGEVGWGGVLLALIGVAQLAFRRRWALLALTGLAYAAVVAFNLIYTIGDIFVMYIPSYLIVVLWMAVGIEALAAVLKKRPALAVSLVVLLFVLPVWIGTRHYAAVDQSQNTQALSQWGPILEEPLPQGAVLISNDRNDIMPLWYSQYVKGMRPDLLGLFPLITPDYPTLGFVLDLALATGRPVYLIKPMPGIQVKADVEPQGTLWRVLGAAVQRTPEYAQDALLDGRVALVGHDRTPQSLRPGDVLRVSLYWEALEPLAEYHSFVHLVDAQGQTIAQSDHQPGGVFYPTTLWRPGERLRDDFVLSIPAGVQPGVYSLLAGMYALSADGTLEALGNPVPLGQVVIETGT
jgi:hypothetical protein